MFLYVAIEDGIAWIGLYVGIYKPENNPLITIHDFFFTKELIEQPMKYLEINEFEWVKFANS